MVGAGHCITWLELLSLSEFPTWNKLLLFINKIYGVTSC